VHRVDDFEFLLDETLACGQFVGVELVFDLVGEALPGDFFPIRGDVLGARIVSKVSLFDQIAATFPD